MVNKSIIIIYDGFIASFHVLLLKSLVVLTLDHWNKFQLLFQFEGF